MSKLTRALSLAIDTTWDLGLSPLICARRAKRLARKLDNYGYSIIATRPWTNREKTLGLKHLKEAALFLDENVSGNIWSPEFLRKVRFVMDAYKESSC